MSYTRSFRTLTILGLLAVAACAVGTLGDEPSMRRAPDSGVPSDASRADGRAGSTVTTGAGSSGSTGITSGGGTSTGGSAGSGSNAAGGGGTNSGGAGTDAPPAIDSGTGCAATEKSCNGRCVAPSPSIGCRLDGCDACPSPPSHATAKCSDNKCDFECASGYERNGGGCFAVGGSDGGQGGSSNDGGGSRCVASQCQECVSVLSVHCCKADNACGCSYLGGPCL